MRALRSFARKLLHKTRNSARSRTRAIRRFIRVRWFRSAAWRNIAGIIHRAPRDDAEHDAYQSYFVQGLREVVPFHMQRAKTQDATPDWPATVTHVGQYRMMLHTGQSLKIAIDASDDRQVRSPEILDWADFYFKTNYWPSFPYMDKVAPLLNGNANLSEDRIGSNCALRDRPSQFDLVFVSRIWAGANAYREHNARIFEALAQAPGKKCLVAVFAGFPEGSAEEHELWDRLTRAGVRCTHDHYSYQELTQLSAEARWVVVRAGVSLCIPWRMVDLLCMGAAILLDNDPHPAWPVRLQRGVNFASLEIAITPESPCADQTDYSAIPAKIASLLADTTLQQRLRRANAAYFDHHAHPTKAAEALLRRCLERV